MSTINNSNGVQAKIYGQLLRFSDLWHLRSWHSIAANGQRSVASRSSEQPMYRFYGLFVANRALGVEREDRHLQFVTMTVSITSRQIDTCFSAIISRSYRRLPRLALCLQHKWATCRADF